MAYALVQTKASAWSTIFSDSSEVVTFDSSVTSGNLVVVVAQWQNNVRTVSSVTASNITFTRADSQTTATPTSTIEIWYGVATGAFTGVTVTLSGDPSANAGVYMYEFSGNAASPTPVTNKSNPTAQNSPVASASVTPSTADNVIVCGIMSSSLTSTSTDGGFTHYWHTGSGSSSYRGLGYMIQSAATAQTWDGTYSTSSEDFNFVIVAFDGAGGGGSTAPLGACRIANAQAFGSARQRF